MDDRRHGGPGRIEPQDVPQALRGGAQQPSPPSPLGLAFHKARLLCHPRHRAFRTPDLAQLIPVVPPTPVQPSQPPSLCRAWRAIRRRCRCPAAESNRRSTNNVPPSRQVALTRPRPLAPIPPIANSPQGGPAPFPGQPAPIPIDPYAAPKGPSAVAGQPDKGFSPLDMSGPVSPPKADPLAGLGSMPPAPIPPAAVDLSPKAPQANPVPGGDFRIKGNNGQAPMCRRIPV